MDQWGTPAAVIAALALFGVLGRFAYWKGTVDEHRKTVDGSLGSIKAILDEIRTDIKSIFRALPAKAVGAGSPLRLTDFGEQIASHLHAKEWAAERAPALRNLTENMQDFEIDAFSDNHVRSEILPSVEWKQKIAVCAYQLGTNDNEIAERTASGSPRRATPTVRRPRLLAIVSGRRYPPISHPRKIDGRHHRPSNRAARSSNRIA